MRGGSCVVGVVEDGGVNAGEMRMVSSDGRADAARMSGRF